MTGISPPGIARRADDGQCGNCDALVAEVLRLRALVGSYIHKADQERRQKQADNADLIAQCIAIWDDAPLDEATESVVHRIIEAVRKHDGGRS